MSNASVLEVVVYGDSPDGGGGGTDVITIPIDMLTFFEPTGPVIVNPPMPPDGGGGTDTPDPKELLEDASEGLFWGGVALAVVSLTTGAGEVVIFGMTLAQWAGVGAVLGTVASHEVDQAAEDPPQPDYARDPAAPPRKVTLRPKQRQAMDALLRSEQQMRLFVDTIECAQGAFLAADAPWVQRHTLAAASTYRDAGAQLANAADTIEESWIDWRDQLGGRTPPPGAAATPALRRLLHDAATSVGLGAGEAKAVVDRLTAAVPKLPAGFDMAATLKPVRRIAAQMSAPMMIDARFAFPKPPDTN
jgi:hypothetical protein